MVKDAAELFAVEGEGARDKLLGLKHDAKDALELALTEAPTGSRERYLFALREILPVLLKIGDEKERRAALDDAAQGLKLGKKDLRVALEEAAECQRRDRAEPFGEDEQEAKAVASPEPGLEPGTERHERAMELLSSPDVPERAASAMERLGHVGDLVVKMLAFVCALSALAGYPLQPSTHAASSVGKNFLWDTLFLLLPPEMVLRWSGMSDKALFFTDEDLEGKIIYLQEVAGSEGADYAIRVLQSAQRLEYSVTQKTPDGSYKAVTYTKEGPVVVVQTTTQIRLFNENDTRVVPIYPDESAEQTRRIVDNALARAESGGISREETEAVLRLWHDAIALLEPAEVAVPYATRIRMPTHRVRVRRDVNRLLDMIRVRAWLHQHVRERDELGRVLATEEDFDAVLDLAADSFGRAWGSMTPVEEAVMGAITSLPEAVRRNGFKRAELSVEGHDARRVQDALKALTESGHIECEKRGGPGGYRYTVPRDPRESRLGISLSPAEGDAAEGGPDDLGEDEDSEPGSGSGRGAPEPRAPALAGRRAIEDPPPPDKAPIALPRDEQDDPDAEYGGDDTEARDEDEVDHLRELTELGWYRAETVFPAVEGLLEAEEDVVARILRHKVAIHKGQYWWSDAVGNPGPLAFTAEDLLEALSDDGEGGADRADPGPDAARQAGDRVARAVSFLQAEKRTFWDPGLEDWYDDLSMWGGRYPDDPEKLRKEAHLHAERWANEETGEEIWALVALREGWYVPERAVERAVWWRVTSGRTPWAEPEELPGSDAIAPNLYLGDEESESKT